jgi:hypothetical protein
MDGEPEQLPAVHRSTEIVAKSRTCFTALYAEESLVSALEHTAHLIRSLGASLSGNDSCARDSVSTQCASFQARTIRSLKPVLARQVVAFLALNNSLHLSNDPSLADKLLGLSNSELRLWIEGVWAGASQSIDGSLHPGTGLEGH